MAENANAKELFNQAMAEFIANNFEKSIALLSEALIGDPQFALALTSRAAAYMKLDCTQEALSDFTRAIDLDPQYARAHHLRGLVHEKLANNQMALKDFDKAMEIDPNYGAAYASRAMLRGNLGQEDLAAEDMAAATNLTHFNLLSFINANNILHSDHLAVEDLLETELER
jgi:tetratricopeptide (TPR) repeat protein